MIDLARLRDLARGVLSRKGGDARRRDPLAAASDRRARAAGNEDLRGDPIGDMWAIERIDLDDRGSP